MMPFCFLSKEDFGGTLRREFLFRRGGVFALD
jgi:hypothetical protein